MHTCCLAVGKSSQGYLSWKESEKVVIVSFERKAGIKQMFAWCYLFVLVQESKCAYTWTRRRRDNAIDSTAGHRQLGRHIFGGKRERALDR